MERNIEQIWGKYEGLLKRLSDHNLNTLLNEQGQRIAECTFNTSSNDSFAGPGGLVEFSLEVAKAARSLNEALSLNCSTKSVLLTALLSDLGRIGDLEQDTFSIQDSDWHRDKSVSYTHLTLPTIYSV